MNFSTLRRQIAQLKAAIPAKKKPFVAIFRSADGTMNPYNLDKLRAARADGAQVITFRFMDQAQIFDEQYRGTKHEHLWGTPPTTDGATP